MAKALKIYFEHFNRQPIWCFEREDVLPYQSIADELAFAILALTAHFLPESERVQNYSSKARNLIMLRVANGSVRLATIESMSLLSFSFFLSKYEFFLLLLLDTPRNS